MISRYSNTITIVKQESEKLLKFIGDTYSTSVDLPYSHMNDLLDTSNAILLFYHQVFEILVLSVIVDT